MMNLFEMGYEDAMKGDHTSDPEFDMYDDYMVGFHVGEDVYSTIYAEEAELDARY